MVALSAKIDGPLAESLKIGSGLSPVCLLYPAEYTEKGVRPGVQGFAGTANGSTPGLVKLEVGLEGDGNNPEQGHVVLYSVFESRVALQAYSSHPQHKAVAAFIKEVASERRVIDYEVFAIESSRSPR